MKHYPFLNLATVNARYLSDIESALLRVARSGQYIGGCEVDSFESELAALTGSDHAVGVSNGLDALRLIFRGYIELGVMSRGDEVIVPSNTYIASVLAVTDCGLKPVFVEPDPATLNMDLNLVSDAVTPRTRAVLTVHLYGRVCYSQLLSDLAERYSLKIVEDNAQGIGAQYHGVMTGALGDAAAFSFYPTKNIGALGDAGAVTTSDRDLADAVRALRNYGSDRQYHNVYAGLNCRMDPVQAAVIRAKLSDVGHESECRRKLAGIYESSIQNPLVVKPEMPSAVEEHVWHQYVVRVGNRASFRKFLADNGVETGVHYPTAMHRQPCYEKEFGHLHLPVAECLAAEVVSLPITRCTSETDAEAIASIVNVWKGV